MPKDEFDFDDPMELSGVALLTQEDTSEAMAECFVEEFMRMGYNAIQVLALFRAPQHLGPNMVLQNRGEDFVRGVIARVFGQWGRPVKMKSEECRMHNPSQIQNPQPEGPNQSRGCGTEFEIQKSHQQSHGPSGGLWSESDFQAADEGPSAVRHSSTEMETNLNDPMGAAIPKLRL